MNAIENYNKILFALYFVVRLGINIKVLYALSFQSIQLPMC